MRYHHTPIRREKKKSPKASDHVEKMGNLRIAGGIENGTDILGNNVAVSYKARHTTTAQVNHWCAKACTTMFITA